MDAYIPGDCLPGLLTGWCGPYEWSWDAIRWYDWPELTTVARDGLRLRLDLRREECRDRTDRVLARVLGVPVGATAPGWWEWYVGTGGWALGSGPHAAEECAVFPRVMPLALTDGQRQTWHHVPALASIPLDSPDREILALAAVARHIGAEIRAGRIQPAEVIHG